MGRIPRIHVPGGIYHVILQGNNGESLFRCEEDHAYFCDILGEGVQRFGHSIHTFCNMTNHVHQAVKAAEEPLKRAYHHDCLKYAKWFNWKYKRKGHLFKGRYKAILVDSEEYLLELIRYIHLNPVRAGMVERPEDYEWSSFRAYLGEDPPEWLTLDWILSMFGEDAQEARARFREFTYRRIDDAGQNGIVSVEFKPVELIVKSVRQIYDLREEEIRAPGRKRRVMEARAVCAAVARDLDNVTMTEIGNYFGRTAAAVSASSLKLLDSAKNDASLAERLHKVKRLLLGI